MSQPLTIKIGRCWKVKLQPKWWKEHWRLYNTWFVSESHLVVGFEIASGRFRECWIQTGWSGHLVAGELQCTNFWEFLSTMHWNMWNYFWMQESKTIDGGTKATSDTTEVGRVYIQPNQINIEKNVFQHVHLIHFALHHSLCRRLTLRCLRKQRRLAGWRRGAAILCQRLKP